MKFRIYYRIHVYHAAEILCEKIQGLGYECELVTEIGSNEFIYILYCAFAVPVLPERYIVIQTEIRNTKWFDKHYENILKGALMIWDYTLANYDSRYRNKSTVVTPGFKKLEAKLKDIDCLFYGSINPRRVLKLETLPFKPMIIDDKYGPVMWDLISRAKIVINLHFYDKSPLETFRINEALAYGCHVISEPGKDMDKYYHSVYFAENPDEFGACALKCFSRPFDYELANLDNGNEVEEAIKQLKALV